MAHPAYASLGRAASLDFPRRGSCDLPPSIGAAAARSRRSVDGPLRAASRGDSGVLAVSVCPPPRREGLVLEVGSSVDVNEQRRRLERFWRTDEPSCSDGEVEEDDEQGSEASSSGRSDVRAHLQQRWQEQSRHSIAGESQTRGRRMGRRRARSAGASLRRSRTPTGKRVRSAGRMRSIAPRTAAAATQCQEQTDQQLLARLTHNLNRRRRTAESASALSSMFSNWGRTDVLSREAEARLGAIVQLGLRTQAALDAAAEQRQGQLSVREMEAAAGCSFARIQLRLGNRRAAHLLLVQYNLRLLSSVARSYEGRGMEHEDLVAEGLTGLDRAVLRFDPAKGYKFSTYAYMWIRQAIGRAIMEHGRVVRLPCNVFELVTRVQKTREVLAAHSPTGAASDEEVAAALGLDAERVASVTAAGRQTLSTEESTAMPGLTCNAEGPDSTLGEELTDEEPSAIEEIEKEESELLMREDIDKVLSGLSLRERNVLRYRYGLHTDALNLGELAAAYGLTRERVRQISEVALAKLQLRQATDAPSEYGGRARHVPKLRPELYGFANSSELQHAASAHL